MHDALTKHDYSVWLAPAVIPPGTDVIKEITSAIDRAVARGFVLLLLSPYSVKSQLVLKEVIYAIEKTRKAAHGANVIPLMIDEPAEIQAAMPDVLRFLLSSMFWFDFSKGDFDTNMDRLVKHMKSCAMD